MSGGRWYDPRMTQPTETVVHHIGDDCRPPHNRGKNTRREWRYKVKCDFTLPHTFTPAGDWVACDPDCPSVTRTAWTCPVCQDVVPEGDTCPKGDGGTRPAPTIRGDA